MIDKIFCPPKHCIVAKYAAEFQFINRGEGLCYGLKFHAFFGPIRSEPILGSFAFHST